MYWANIQVFSFILLICKISSRSISFSYRSCLPNIDLIHIEHYHLLNSQQFQLLTKDFHLNIIYRYKKEKLQYKFGNLNILLGNLSNFDYQYQSAINYYHQIDTWTHVNLIFDDSLSRVFISFNNDETRKIPLVDYPLLFQNKTIETKLNIRILVNEQDKNLTCLLPYKGFEISKNSFLNSCVTNIKTCEHRICTSSNNAEQYCPLFKIFDCYPFTDLQCGLQTIPVLCSTNDCLNQGFCHSERLRNSSQCVCPFGFAGDQCEYDINECQSNPCPKQSTCIDMPDGYSCVCDPGWTGVDCSEDIDECKTTQSCKAARNCINLPGSYRCECFESFTGFNCEMTLDPCLSQPCLNNATKCHSILDRDHVLYHCVCQSGFTGHNCETNINDCEGIICQKNNTQCIDGVNSFHCECKSNFKRNWDSSCVEQNPCDSSPCHQNATCYNLNGGQYRCMCPPTYTGVRCDEDIDECSVFPFICRNGGTCVNDVGSYRCYCAPGWIGSTCAKAIDYCISQPCNRNGTCINKINGFECRCLSPYTGDVCQYDIDECLIEPCVNNGTCYNYVGGFHCRCPTGYFGFRCEYPPSECERYQKASFSVKCNDPHLCVVNDTEKLRQLNQLTTYTCRTERDRTLDNYFTCSSEQKYNYCHCPSNILPCADNYTETSNRPLISRASCPCHNGGTCHWINSKTYRCYCSPGLTGENCLIQIDHCLSRPCYNNGTCLSQLNSFTCQCPTSYKGIYCQNLIDRCEKNPCLNNGTCQRFKEKYKCNCLSSYTANLINNQVVFGYKSYAGCVRNIEITYSQAYSILLTDHLIETNENRTLGCERTNACQNAVCQKNELCEDHWFYHRCQCQRPFFGENCDLIPPIITFNQSSSANILLSSPISNMSLFFNTLQSNGTLFELVSSMKHYRSTRDLTSQNRSASKIIGGLINGRFRLIIIDDGPKRQEFELRSEQTLNDGRPHQIELDLENYRLIIDGIHNETLKKANNKLLLNQIELLGDGSLNGWLQGIRINDQLISFDHSNQIAQNFNITSLNMNEIEHNPCYPNNPCLNEGICLITHSQDYLCQCDPRWFGRICSEPNICNYNNSSLCPNGFICKVSDDNQECLATATFEGNTSSLIATLHHSSVSKISNEISFRLRARPQNAHLLTIKNLYTSNYFSLYLFGQNLIYRDSILTTDLIIELNESVFDEWTTFHLHWSDFSTLTINYLFTYTINLSLKSLLTPNSQTQIYIGNGFRGCLEFVLIGENLYVPFYNDIIYDNDTRQNKFFIEQIENIHINNCSFNHVCENVNCQNGLCYSDFDRGKCICNIGWNGDFCQMNINECELGNNCSKENSICEDHLDGYYTCKCQQGFTGQFCETNIDECASSPCANNGTCTDLIDGYLCNCTKEYINSNCSKSIDATCFGQLHSCENNGTCILKSTHLYVDNPESECECLNGYDGLWCENDLCSQLHCQNDGTCQRLPNGKAKCLCKEQFDGNECEHDVNECELTNQTEICLNNGKCINYPGGYRCQCQEYYLGEHCEHKHICLDQSPCLNRGQCKVDGGEQYYCVCLRNFTGVNCELLTCESTPCHHNGTCTNNTDHGFICNCTGTGYEDEQCTTEINECLSNPCQNNASCINERDGYICICPKDFIGLQCESRQEFLRSLGFSYHYIIWPSMAILLLMIITLFTIAVGRVKENRRLQGTYRPALNEHGQTSRVEFSMILKPPPEERLI
ncbi:unnamed protein product [Rotaria magnacalcarata]|uniref:Uncharacterized protein n=1 Tax=Rotaria magnacalcarata TaxID=392030 RepID=A0A819DQE5_9BILA|nr:unnamed protein product [Rotaria magnacalcarata]